MKKIFISALLLLLVFALIGCTEGKLPVDPEPPVDFEPPPLLPSISFNTLEEMAAYVNERDSEKGMVEIIKKNGFLLEARYKGKPLQAYEVKEAKNELDLVFSLIYDTEYKYTAYQRRFETDEGVVGSLVVYYLDEANIEDARENPYRHYTGNYRQYSLEQALSSGWERKDLSIAGKEVIAFQSPFGLSINPNNDVEWLVFSWEDKFVVQIHFNKNDQKFGVMDFVKDLTFEMLPLKKGE